jgi:DNA-binding CsgD family transcriptional regulator
VTGRRAVCTRKLVFPSSPVRAYDLLVGSYAKQRAKEKIADLAGQGHDLVTFWHGATEAIAPAIPFYLTPCFYTMDPASLLATSHYHDGLPEIPHEWLALEYYEEDFNKMADVARSERGVCTLHEATGGDVSRSGKYRVSMQPFGADQEVLAGLRTPSGEVWGVLALYREPGQHQFDAEELELLRALSGNLAEGARRGLLIAEASEPEGPEAPGLVVLRDDWEIESLTPGVEHWLADLPDGEWDAGKLPPAVLSVAGRARRSAEDSSAPGEIAFARVLSRSGRWMVLHGASLVSDGRRRIAVIVEPAHPARITPLLMAAYALTEREQEVTRLVLQGDSTAQIAERLVVSPNTVQEHLKSIFEKTGVRSRRDLVGKVFFSHYEPRLRENEQRVIQGQPARGGPLPGAPRANAGAGKLGP